MTNAAALGFMVVLGLMFGSFANVLILRDADRRGILTGRSRCPGCGRTLSWYELLPVVSFLIQGGRCRGCRRHISWQYPLVEVLMAGLFGLAWWGTDAALLAGLLAASFFFFLVFAGIDARTQEVPLEYVGAAGLFGFLYQAASGVSVFSPLGAALIGAGSILLIRGLWQLLAKQEGMGEGDVYIAAAVGLLAGWPALIPALLLAVFAGAFVGSVAIALKKSSLQSALAFGPFLAAGAVVAVFWGERLVAWYTTVSGFTSL